MNEFAGENRTFIMFGFEYIQIYGDIYYENGTHFFEDRNYPILREEERSREIDIGVDRDESVSVPEYQVGLESVEPGIFHFFFIL